MRALLIRLNNAITRLRGPRVRPEHLLLLLPHCLQNSGCGQNIIRGPDQCRLCGQCDVTGLLNLRKRYGILCNVVGGGRQALNAVKHADVRAVVAVACEKELLDGIRASFPKPVLAVPNLQPNGPCKDTRVDLAQVEAAIREVVDLPEPAA